MGLIISEIIADNLFSVYDTEWDAQGAQDNGTESAQEEMIARRDLAGAVLVIREGGEAMDHFQ